MATDSMYTEAQRTHAELLVSRSRTWTRATRKSDGLAFVIFPSSQCSKSGASKAYYTTESACCCPGFQHRGQCSHVLAVQTEAEQARERFCRPKPLVSYENVYGLVDAF